MAAIDYAVIHADDGSETKLFPAQVPPETDGRTVVAAVRSSSLNLRSEPVVSPDTAVGSVKGGTRLEVSLAYFDSAPYRWRQVGGLWVAQGRLQNGALIAPPFLEIEGEDEDTGPLPPPPPPEFEGVGIVDREGHPRLAIDGEWRFSIGGCVREAVMLIEPRHSSLHAVPPDESEAILEKQMIRLNHQEPEERRFLSFNAQWFRFYAGGYPVVETIRRVKRVLDMCQRYHLRPIIVLNDSLVSGLNVPGEQRYHDHHEGHLGKAYWLAGYEMTWLPFLEVLLPAVAAHGWSGLFELINEPTCDDPETFELLTNALTRVNDLCKKLAPDWLTAPGIINTSKVTSWSSKPAQVGREFYEHSGFDVGTLHQYCGTDGKWQEEAEHDVDVAIFHALRLPYLYTETMTYNDAAYQPDLLDAKWKRSKTEGASAKILWGLQDDAVDRGFGGHRSAADFVNNREMQAIATMITDKWCK